MAMIFAQSGSIPHWSHNLDTNGTSVCLTGKWIFAVIKETFQFHLNKCHDIEDALDDTRTVDGGSVFVRGNSLSQLG